MIVVVRLDLDKYDLRTIEKLVINGVITMGEATESKSVKKMNDLEKLMWIREQQRVREPMMMNKVG